MTERRVLRTIRLLYPLLLAMGVYIALASSRLTPLPLLFIVTTTISLVLMLSAIRVALAERTGLTDIVLLVVTANILGIIGLLDMMLSLMYSSAILLVLIDGSEIGYCRRLWGFVKINKMLLTVTLLYIALLLVLLRLDYLALITGAMGLESIRSFITLVLTPKATYMLLGLLIGLAMIIASKYVLVTRRGMLSELNELERILIRELYGVGADHMFIIELVLLASIFLIYPLTVYFALVLHLPSSTLYIAGILLSFTIWCTLRRILYNVFSLDVGENIYRRLLIAWLVIAVITCLFILNLYTRALPVTILGYENGVQDFNDVYRGLIKLEFESIKLLVELLWG